MTAPRWFAVRTKPGGEYLAETELRRVGMTAYLPQYRREYQHHRSKRWVIRAFPLFTGYVFVAEPKFEVLRWLDGLETERRGDRAAVIISAPDGQPLPIPDGIVRDIQAREATGEFDELKRQGFKLSHGQYVAMKDGPLAGAAALVHSVKSAKNLRIIVPLFGGVVAKTTVAKVWKAA